MKYRLIEDISKIGGTSGHVVKRQYQGFEPRYIEIEWEVPLSDTELLKEVKKNKIELWEKIPRIGTMIWAINSFGKVVEIQILGINWEKFLFKSKNMHKTRESAEEALRLIMSS